MCTYTTPTSWMRIDTVNLYLSCMCVGCVYVCVCDKIFPSVPTYEGTTIW